MPIPRVCPSCGKGFTISPSRLTSDRGKYCSVACRGISKRAGQDIRICAYCKKEFTASLASNWKNQRYCSWACVSLDGSNRSTPFEERLVSQISFPNDEKECAFWTGNKDKAGYGKITKKVNGEYVHLRTHRAVYELYFGPLVPMVNVLHSCDRPSCCNILHLFVGSQSDNMKDKVSKDRQAKGETNGRAKLTEREVMKIKRLIKEGIRITDIAGRFDVGITTISEIKAGRTWKHIPFQVSSGNE